MMVKHQADTLRKLRNAARRVRSHLPAHLPPVFFLTDPERVPDPMAVVERLPAGYGVIYRHFGDPDRGPMASALASIAARRGQCLLIAADPKLAISVGAHGVHWPEARLGEAREWRKTVAINTASAHSRRAIHRAAKAGMDAALVSTIFPSNSPSANRPVGPARLAKLCANTSLPLYGLGGINASNAAQIAEFAGLAAIEGLGN